MTKKLKTAVQQITTREEMESVVRELCRLTIEQDELTAGMDRQILDVRKVYEPRLSAISEEIQQNMIRAEDWAKRNQQEFATKKSVIMAHGTVGFRTGTPKLTTLKGFTWAKVLEVLKKAFPDFIRTKPEVDKEMIIANRETLGERQLSRMGVQVVQEEGFFVEPLRTQVDEVAS